VELSRIENSRNLKFPAHPAAEEYRGVSFHTRASNLITVITTLVRREREKRERERERESEREREREREVR
jgi:hypothetical protein